MSGGGDSTPPPSNTTVQQNTIAPEAAPYYSSLLGQASAVTDINQNPHQAYQGERTAGFSPMQQQSFSNLENMQTPGQTTDASNAAYNSINQAQNYQNYQPQQFQNQYAGPQFQGLNAQTGSWTDPGVAASYMSPYIEQAINPALDQMQRQSDIRQRDMSGQAQQAGAFGGYRHGLQLSEEQRNTERAKGDLSSQMMNQGYAQAGQMFGADAARGLQAQGMNVQQNLAGQSQNLANAQNSANFGQQANNAYEQSRQFGGNLGIQGLNAGLQGAQTLGQLGQQQFGQNLGLNQAQQLAGGQQQDQGQKYLNTQYQNFTDNQNWAYKNLGFMSDVIGRPLTNQSTSIYSAPPTASQNMLGLGLGAYGLSGMMGGKAKGGLVKGYADGGVVRGYASGGSVFANMSDQQLQKMAAARPPTLQSMAAGQELMKRQQARTAQPTPPELLLPQMQGGPQQEPQQQPMPQEGGVAGLPAGDMQFADGGIVGFAEGGPPPDLRRMPWMSQDVADRNQQRMRGGRPPTDVPSQLFAAQTPEEWKARNNFGLPEKAAATPVASAPVAEVTDNWDRQGVAAKPEIRIPAAKPLTKAKAKERDQQMAEATGYKAMEPPKQAEAMTMEQAQAQLRAAAAAETKDNPLYKRRDEIAGQYDAQRGQDKYAAAINAAQSILGSKNRQGGIGGVIGDLATGAASAGEGQLKREKEHVGNQEKLFQLDAALRAGDQKTASELAKMLQESGMKRDVINAHIFNAQSRNQTALEDRRLAGINSLATARISAVASAAASGAYSANQNAQRALSSASQDIAKIEKQATENIKNDAAGNLLSMSDPAAFTRRVNAEVTRLFVTQQPIIEAKLRRGGVDPVDVFGALDAPATTRVNKVPGTLATGIK